MSGGTIQGAAAQAADSSLSGMSSLDNDNQQYLRHLVEADGEVGDLVPLPGDNLEKDLADIMEEAIGWDVTGDAPVEREDSVPRRQPSK